MDTLDNIFWHALNGPQRQFSEGNDRARRYLADVATFGAVPDDPRAEDYASLREVVGPRNVAVLFRDSATPPEQWELLDKFGCVQMIGPNALDTGSTDPRVVTLGLRDVDDMMELTSRTKPGPFARRTWELGGYLGVRVDGHLIAMAGRRAQTVDHVEISAVCTDPQFVGRGLGRALILAQIEAIAAIGKVPMLHTAATNTRAIALYEHLGFKYRRTMPKLTMRAPS